MSKLIAKTETATLSGPPSGSKKYVLRLYVTGASALSRRAILNINAICNEHLEGRFDLEIIDIHQKPTLAKDEQIVAAPTLIKRLPLPLRRIVGDLSNRQNVLFGLDLKRKA
ncbi:MAG TPA: circadian clock KaiB family protein [Candidatus Sulfotelmatobacter sp.]